ncbi:site-specific integrase [Anaerolentibacter hominis]|uniref:tyrosine-type recombinase/integrase n=1 Tax=Anaerolentibacter hominis TaxID=3079009 RepID=UPI0031B8911E
MARHGENIYQRKDGRFEGRYVKGKRENGTTCFGYVYGKKYTEVKKKLLCVKAQMEIEKREYRNTDGLTAGEWLWLWLENGRPQWKDSTYGVYRGLIEKHLIPYIGQMPLEEINTASIHLIRSRLEEVNPGAAAEAATLRLLKSVLKTAVEEGRLEKLPLFTPVRKKWDQNSPRYLTREEQNRLERIALEKKRYEVLVALYTGLRVGEVAALQWQDVDLNTGTIFVNHTILRISQFGGPEKTALRLGEPKTRHSRRSIPIPASLTNLLRDARPEKAEGTDFLFGKDGRMPDPRSIQSRFCTLVQRAGLADVHFHTLRHTFATRCLEYGFHLELIRDLLGHSSANITLQFYAHSTDQFKREAMNRFPGPNLEEAPGERAV